MSKSTNIFIDGEHAATLQDLQNDEPWYFGTLQPAGAFEELLNSLDKAPWSTNQDGAVELVAGQDTVDRVSWGADVDTSEMITKLTLARFTADGPWELEFTCEAENSESGAEEPEESAA
ncbi:MAG: hypothetical protein KF754_06370 [Planctomycetes bacterium]|nr:hypothetical protein [Planctomycetota bacterium]